MVCTKKYQNKVEIFFQSFWAQQVPKWVQNEKLTIRISEFLHKVTIAKNRPNTYFFGNNPVLKFFDQK